ncbi:MAG: GspE/PulE family protein [Planctomycetes bacterium]|nr:GspE/PulE family protein [Planctomycetota bacterium]
MVPSAAFERFFYPGGVWIALAVAWAASCMWVDRDARVTLGRSMPWSLLYCLVGVLLLLAGYYQGLASLPLFVLVVPAALVGYCAYRDTKAPPFDKILHPRTAVRMIRAVAEPIGLGPTVDRIFSQPIRTVARGPAQIQLVKKDGTVVDSRGRDETSRAVKSLQDMFLKVVPMRATDIHMEPKSSDEMVVRCRIDGMLQKVSELPAEEGRAVLSAMKVLADMDIAERRRPQDGTFAVIMGERRFDVRAASAPTNYGEKMSLRLLDADGGMVKGGLAKIGLKDSILKPLREICQQPHGMLIVCGPTGSGKTTTLYSALGEIDVYSRNIITIEDPIEYRLEGISQTAVNNAADLTFAKILRSVLRQDPDVILVGEIRDKETAEIAMQAAMTGHFVFTTLHANDAPTTITRLLDLGVDISLVQSAVTAVLAQRLVRLLCEKCREPYDPPAEERQRLGIPLDRKVTLYRAREQGCPQCLGTGYKGRTGVHELLVFDNAIRDLLVGRPSVQVIRATARKGGMRTLLESGVGKVLAGQTSVDEVVRVLK